jgi:hypothetical protein
VQVFREMGLPFNNPRLREDSGPAVRLRAETYSRYFRYSLICEAKALAQNLEGFTLYTTVLSPEPEMPGLFKIHVPALREFVPPAIPSILISDVVRLRLVLPPMFGTYYIDPVEYVTYIHRIDRRKVPPCDTTHQAGIYLRGCTGVGETLG